MNETHSNTSQEANESQESRRRFLETAGRFAAVTPPAITLLLTSGRGNPAWASGNNGFGNGGFDGVPGRSGKQDITR